MLRTIITIQRFAENNRKLRIFAVLRSLPLYGFESIDNVYKQRRNSNSMDSCVETLPTDCLDGFLSSPEDVRDSEDTQAVCWGRMFPLGTSCTAFGMICV